jgi:hypothetical protein
MLFSLAASRIFNGHPCNQMHMTKPIFTFHKRFANGVMGVPSGTKFIPGFMKTGELVQSSKRGRGTDRHTHEHARTGTYST